MILNTLFSLTGRLLQFFAKQIKLFQLWDLELLREMKENL